MNDDDTRDGDGWMMIGNWLEDGKGKVAKWTKRIQEYFKEDGRMTILLVTMAASGLVVLLIYLRIKRRGATVDGGMKEPSQFFSAISSGMPTREALWTSKVEPFVNDSISYYQYMLKNRNVPSLHFDAQWRFSPSYSKALRKSDKRSTDNSYGFVQYRTQSLVGREAGLPRVFSSATDFDTTSFANRDSIMYVLEQVRYVISLLYYRLPRASAEWELWLSLAMSGLYAVWMMQPKKDKPKSRKAAIEKLEEIG